MKGDVVVTSDGNELAVVGLDTAEADITAYNLTVADLHTYFAGATSVLVHNAGCDPFDAARALKGADPEDVLDAIPDNWLVSTPRKALGGGIRFSNPANKSEVIIFERGTGVAADGIHGGPYLRLSTGRGPIERIPLQGNPALGGP